VRIETLEMKMRRGAESRVGMAFAAALGPLVAGAYLIRLMSKGAPWWQIALGVLFGVGLVSFAWNSWSESKEWRLQYQHRLSELLEGTYHEVSFAMRDEAVAFVAELSRRLVSADQDLASWEEDVEVSVRILPGGTTTLYLSDGAMRAFSPEFPAPPNMQQVPGKSLSQLRVAVISGALDKPLPDREIARRFDGKPARGIDVSFRLTRPA
jgi:hypothetical protein